MVIGWGEGEREGVQPPLLSGTGYFLLKGAKEQGSTLAAIAMIPCPHF